jgi:hypothetical protein
MTRDLWLELLAERFGTLDASDERIVPWLAPAPKLPHLPPAVIRYPSNGSYDARPWTSREAWADEYLDWRAA